MEFKRNQQSARLYNFIGFATQSASVGSQCVVATGPVVTGLTVTAGSTYYLTDTNGTIGTTPGTIVKKLGLASTSSTLVIDNVPRLGSWTQPIVAGSPGTPYQALTDGFVVGYGDSSGSSVSITVKTDSSATPTTVRTKGYDASYAGVCCPVKKGDYVQVDINPVGSTYSIYWIPLQ